MKLCNILYRCYQKKIVMIRTAKMNLRLLFFIFNLVFLNISGYTQKPLDNDTVICIVNTKNSFTHFKENPSKKYPKYHWEVFIEGSYYNDTQDADIAGVGFTTNFSGNSWIEGPFIISVPIEEMDKRYTVVTDSWINRQQDLRLILQKIGMAPGHKYNFVVFKQDMLQSPNGYVKAYRVLMGYSEVQY